MRRAVHFGAGPEWSLSQLGATAAAMGGVAVYLASLSLAVGGFDAVWWALVLLPLLTMAWAGSAAPLVYWALLLYGWFTLTPAGQLLLVVAPGRRRVRRGARRDRPVRLVAAGRVVHRADRTSLGAPHRLWPSLRPCPSPCSPGSLPGVRWDSSRRHTSSGSAGSPSGLWFVRTSPPVERE